MKTIKILAFTLLSAGIFASCSVNEDLDEIVIEQPATDDGDDEQNPPQPPCNGC